jgi:hypothetical protein
MADFTCDTNFLAPSGFKITISRENFPNISFFAQQVQHPGMEVNAVEQPYRRVASIPFIGDTIQFGGVSMDIILDEGMNVYQEMFEWLERMVEVKHRPNTGSLYTSDNQLSHYCDIRISILNSANNVVREIKYVNAFPTSLGDITFAATQDQQFITFPVTFRFDYFDFV